MSDFNERIKAEFRANQGKVGPPFEGAPMLILHTRGAKSGEEREHPLVYFDVDGQVFIIASAAGAPKHPAWFHNLTANPDVRVEFGTETVDATARVTEGSEREQLFNRFAVERPGFAEYQEKTDRAIPVVELVR